MTQVRVQTYSGSQAAARRSHEGKNDMVLRPRCGWRRHAQALWTSMAALMALGGLHAGQAPSGGRIVSGSGAILQSGHVTTIRQSSQTLMLNWQSFDVSQDQNVNFIQPGSDAIAINRIFSTAPSEIYGHLSANGQVWLINPNGILFGPGAQVNVAGLVASTLDVDDSTLRTGAYRFSGSGKGSVINRGKIVASDGGYVALLGNHVSNQGVIAARLGTVALAGGQAMTLTFNRHQLLNVQVDQSTLDNLAENRQLIVADGGKVLMTAGAKDALLASVVNNRGIVRAQAVENHNGEITLVGGMAAGTADVAGTLDASAPDGGDGGRVETSAAHVNFAGDTHILIDAPFGKPGTWLIDPIDIRIDNVPAPAVAGTLAYLQSQLRSWPLATPYGTAEPGVTGIYHGNPQRSRRPIERNRNRADFHSGLSLEVEQGGVRLPSDALP